MTDLSQTSGRCSDNQLFPVGSCSIHDFDPHGVGRESVVGVQLTSWGDHQLVVAALDVGHLLLARYRHSRGVSVEHVRIAERSTEHALVAVVKMKFISTLK